MMIRAKTNKEIDKLTKELGMIEKRRREILTSIRSHPLYASAYINSFFKSKIEEIKIEEGIGLYMSFDAKGQKLPLKENLDKIFTLHNLSQIDGQSGDIIGITYSIRYLNGIIVHKSTQVSINRPLEPQIFSSAFEIAPDEFKKIKNEIAKNEAKVKRLKEIEEIEAKIAEMEVKLDKLKRAMSTCK